MGLLVQVFTLGLHPLAWAAGVLMPGETLGEVTDKEAYWVTPGFVRAALELEAYRRVAVERRAVG